MNGEAADLHPAMHHSNRHLRRRSPGRRRRHSCSVSRCWRLAGRKEYRSRPGTGNPPVRNRANCRPSRWKRDPLRWTSVLAVFCPIAANPQSAQFQPSVDLQKMSGSGQPKRQGERPRRGRGGNFVLLQNAPFHGVWTQKSFTI